ncbi:MAG: molybdopterin-guanine dinucleotide biosynthesis protein MobB [Firmicutes bacterium]|nr:molybdopterin-guanine dinucleotide biosynthesis protein MobB [Bacillota bacterium]
MKLFAVVGVSSSGKTTTIEAVIRELRRRGYSVGSVKEIHFQEFAIDTAGSNTDRHRRAGAQLVAARGFHETDVLYQRKLTMDEILLHYDYDFVALEGVSDIPVPTVITAHSEDEVRQKLTEHSFAVSGRLADRCRQAAGLPALSALTKITELTDLVEEQAREYLPPHRYTLDGRPLTARQNALLAAALGALPAAALLREVEP